MALDPVPLHGVSGFQTTGIAGDYGFQFHDHIDLKILDVAASRYGLQQRGSAETIKKSEEDYTQDFNDPNQDYTTPEPNESQFTSEPEFEELEKLQYKYASKIKSHQLQRSAKRGLMASYMENKMYEGFGQYDPQIQTMLRDPGTDTDYIPSAYQPSKKKHQPFQISPGIRQNEHQGTSNPVYQISGVVSPYGNDDHTDMANQTTNELLNVSNAATGTHPEHAEAMVHTLGTNPMMGISGSIVEASPYNVAGLAQPPQPDIRPMGYIVPLAEKTVMEQTAGRLQQRYL